MKFNKDDKIQDWHLLTKDEAEAYLRFLEYEKYRHEEAINQSLKFIGFFSLNPRGFYIALDKARIRLEASAIRRHKKDIVEIDRLIVQIKHWYGLNNKEGKK